MSQYRRPVEPVYAAVGACLRKERERQQLTAQEVAASLGVLRQTLTSTETGARRLPLHRFIELCEYLHLDPVEVLAHVVDHERT